MDDENSDPVVAACLGFRKDPLRSNGKGVRYAKLPRKNIRRYLLKDLHPRNLTN